MEKQEETRRSTCSLGKTYKVGVEAVPLPVLINAVEQDLPRPQRLHCLRQLIGSDRPPLPPTAHLRRLEQKVVLVSSMTGLLYTIFCRNDDLFLEAARRLDGPAFTSAAYLH